MFDTLEALLKQALENLLNANSVCLVDPLNPCWHGDTLATEHWAATPEHPIRSCPVCEAKAALAKAKQAELEEAEHLEDLYRQSLFRAGELV